MKALNLMLRGAFGLLYVRALMLSQKIFERYGIRVDVAECLIDEHLHDGSS